ncbi:MAG: isoprenylcysteine carboxylmethyltransferase family protein [Candidatus Paceibacterota bacterium]|jgi:protein-S-isoprenylcysteine O-methyltransferase Ste14
MYGGGTKDPKRVSVHRVLVRSYYTSLLFFLIGVCLDMIFRLNILKGVMIAPAGFIFLIAGTWLIIWAQHTSRNFQNDNITSESFRRGPYSFTRNPTYWGLYLVLFGFGLVINAIFVLASTIVSFFITKFFFLKQEEKILAEKYGDAYLEYKKSVHT